MRPLQALRELLRREGLDGVIVTRFDAHQTPYCPPHEERLAFLTGFTGSAGLAVILQEQARLFVDGRYQVQARQEIDTAIISVGHLIEETPSAWLCTAIGRGGRIALDPMHLSAHWFALLQEAFRKAGAEVVLTARDFIGEIWQDRPAPPLKPVYPVVLACAGESSAAKRARVAAALGDAGADYLIEAQPDNIAWLLNLRGGDAAYNPMPQSFLVIDRNGEVEWLVDPRKVPNDLSGFELDGVRRADPRQLIKRIEALAAGHRLIVDPELAPAAASLAAGPGLLPAKSPVSLLKARKNAVELRGFRQCHRADGAAWCAFLAWLEREVAARGGTDNPVTEFEAEEKLLDLKRAQPGFLEPSFQTIAAFGPNAAMCHYHASRQRPHAIELDGLFLVDAGSHFSNGTTDATRTIPFGQVPHHVRRAYTAVVKSFIAMLTLRFPKGTMGHQIDAFARRPLWDLGLDFDHGVGHSVGHCLSVHEYPHRFSKAANNFVLEAGMVMTIEPGNYAPGDYGIRIENTVEIVEDRDGFLKFSSLTAIPLQTKPILADELTLQEMKWIRSYNENVRNCLVSKVDFHVYEWICAN